jgi:hypothetical protein
MRSFTRSIPDTERVYFSHWPCICNQPMKHYCLAGRVGLRKGFEKTENGANGVMDVWDLRRRQWEFIETRHQTAAIQKSLSFSSRHLPRRPSSPTKKKKKKKNYIKYYTKNTCKTINSSPPLVIVVMVDLCIRNCFPAPPALA